MSTATTTPDVSRRAALAGYPTGGARFNWTFIVLAFLLAAGAIIDGWAHNHGRTDNTFFTPWHLLLYSALGLVALFLSYHQLRNVQKGYAFTKALPHGYWLSLVGVGIFGLGGVGDLIWHTLFGIEQGSQALLSPTHVTILAVGGVLIVTGPIRAAWHETSKSWLALGPAILSLTLLLITGGFFTSYANPFITPAAAMTHEQPITQSSEVYVMNADGTGQTRLTNNPNAATVSGSWSPDGKQIVVSRNNEHGSDLYILNADGSMPVQITNMSGMEIMPVWSPDGKKIVFVWQTQDAADIYTINIDGTDLVQVTNTPDYDWGATWSPDGKQIAFTRGRGSDSIVVVNADGSAPRTLISGNSFGLHWSPDGKQIVYTAQINGNYDIYLANSDGSNLTRLTTDPAFDGSPAWSPDGQSIVFQSRRAERNDIYRMPISGETETIHAVNLTQNPALNSNIPVVSPDGKHILFTALGLDSGSYQYQAQDAGVAAILLNAALIAGIALFMVRRWQLPFGAVTLMLTLYVVAMSILGDQYRFIPAALISGLIGDLIVWRLKPSVHPRALHLIGFLLSFLLFALYMLTIQLTQGIGWSIHVWMGMIFVAGLVGLTLSYLMILPSRINQSE